FATRHTKAKAALIRIAIGCSLIRRRIRSSVSICLISLGDHLKHEVQIVAGQAEDTDTVETATSRDNALGGQQTTTRLQAQNVVECGRNTTRARSVRAEGETHKPLSHSHGRAGTGAAGNKSGIETVVAHA